MGKGSRRHRSTNHKKKKKSGNPSTNTSSVKKAPLQKKSEMMRATLSNETTQESSSVEEKEPSAIPQNKGSKNMTDTPSSDPNYSVIELPDGSREPTTFEKLFAGVKQLKEMDDRVKDFLKNSKITEASVAAKKGELTADNTQDEPTGKVIIMRDHHLNFPELHLKVLVTGPPEDTAGFPHLLSRAYCKEAKDVEDADLVVFTGGPDVDPAYYGESPVPSYWGDDERDYADLATYITCLEEGVPMLGVCRGAQFLAVMNGAKLIQDIDNHKGDHSMYDKRGRYVLERISSVHHQAVLPADGMEVLGVSFVSTQRWLGPNTLIEKNGRRSSAWEPEIEAFWFRETCAIGLQGHPEYRSYNAYAKWSLDLIDELINLNPDLEIINGRRRMKPDLIAQRLLQAKETAKPKKEKKILTIVDPSSPTAEEN